MAKPRFQNPKGTRDLYPEEMLRRRYLTGVWRDTSIRHGFEEIDGPTFETSELYAVKSGEGILGELFQAFSGKSPEEVERVQKEGRAPFALRPEFTPTLARMYAARAAQLARPTKWFSIGPFFRAERPQRGRLREFLQWNCDILGDEGGETRTDADVQCIATQVSALRAFGIADGDARVHLNDRSMHETWLRSQGLGDSEITEAFTFLDRLGKMKRDDFIAGARERKIPESYLTFVLGELEGQAGDATNVIAELKIGTATVGPELLEMQKVFAEPLEDAGIGTESWKVMLNIFRGLAYYTGTVFEVIAEGERAVAGGGRYDNLIELLGGPPTPAVGFAMGDVVLSLLLEDKGLMPEGAELLDAVSGLGASLRPEAFVVTPHESLDPEVRRLVAGLRRGTERAGFDGKPWAGDRYEVRPLHARRSYKATRNVGKLIKDATGQHAKTLVIVESAEHATVQHLDTKEKLENIALDRVGATVAALTGR